MSYTVLAHVSTGDLATAALQNTLLDDVAIIKTQIADNGSVVGPLNGWTEKYQTATIVAGDVAADLKDGNHIIVNFTANITSFTITNSIQLGLGVVLPIVFYFVNDGTLRTVAWVVDGLNVKFDAGVAPVFTGTNGKIDEVTLKFFDFGQILGQQTGVNK